MNNTCLPALSCKTPILLSFWDQPKLGRERRREESKRNHVEEKCRLTCRTEILTLHPTTSSTLPLHPHIPSSIPSNARNARFLMGKTLWDLTAQGSARIRAHNGETIRRRNPHTRTRRKDQRTTRNSVAAHH